MHALWKRLKGFEPTTFCIGDRSRKTAPAPVDYSGGLQSTLLGWDPAAE
jgi:hypothetical protein